MFSTTALTGIGRGILAWQSLNGTPYLAVGTDKRLQLYTAGDDADITPVRDTTNVTNAFSTTNGSAIVTYHDVANGAQDGEGIVLVTPISVGGIILHGYYDVTTSGADDNQITAASLATSTVVLGGKTAKFTTVNGSPSVNVEFANHGFSVGAIYTVYVSTISGGLTLFGNYMVDAVVDANNFTITANANASSNDTDSENGGAAKINYLIAPGLVNAAAVQGFGLGGWGLGGWGFGLAADRNSPPRQWHMLAWGEDLIANPTNGPMYYWTSSSGLEDNPAVLIATAPMANTAIFLAMPQRQVVVLGAEDNGVQVPLLVKYSNVDDYSAYRDVGSPTDPNSQAGWYRIPSGSRIVGGIQGPSQGLIWTDLALWVMQYIGPPFVYGFNKVGDGCGLVGARAMGIVNQRVMWISTSGVFMYNGGNVIAVPCTVWDKWFKNIDLVQAEKITCCANSNFNELAWCGQSKNSVTGENDIYIKYNVAENVWDYGEGKLSRTAWTDQSIWGPPIGVGAPDPETDQTQYVYQHEVGNDADDLPMLPYAQTSWAYLAEGEVFAFIERFIPDFKFEDGSGAKITILMKEYANETCPVYTYGPYTITEAVNYAIVRGRNRLLSFIIESDDLGSFWRLGKTLEFGSGAGKR